VLVRDGVREMPRRVGRSAVPRDPNERVPIATRLRGSVYNRLIDAAARNDRSLGNEFELRVEQSLAAEADQLLSPELRGIALMLAGHYVMIGPTGVVRLLLALPDAGKEPDEAERRRRWQTMTDLLAGIGRIEGWDQ
jgi:TraY domain